MPENGAKPSELLLRPNQAAFCFSGETQIESQLLDKQIIDFNVMTKRGKYRAYIERLELNGSLSAESSETRYINDAYQTSNVHNNELQQWLLCLEPLNLVYQGQIIQLKRYDMVQCLRGQNLKAQPSKMKRLEEIETSDATSSDAELPILKHSHIENPSLLNHKQCQVLRIVIECTKKF